METLCNFMLQETNIHLTSNLLENTHVEMDVIYFLSDSSVFLQ